MNINVVYFPLARTTFSMDDAEDNFVESCSMLERVFGNIKKPAGLITSVSMMTQYFSGIGHPDLIIYQCSTFVGSEFMTEISRQYNCPIVIWAVREPSFNGGRLKLNSLTGAFSAGNSLYSQGTNYQFVFGNPDEAAVNEKFNKIYKALELIKKLRNLTIGIIGSQPPGFGFGAIDDFLLAGTFGIRVIRTEASRIMKEADAYEPDDYSPFIEELRSRAKGLEQLPESNLEKYARLRKAYQDFITNNNVNAIASKCWPDFFTNYGAPVCSVLSMLNDNGIPASGEADTGGVISMIIGSGLTGGATYLGDPVAIDESCDGIVFWHCGAGATSLSRKDEVVELGVHPNRKIGPTMEFGLKQGKITVLRLGLFNKEFRMFAMKGTALDEPQKFNGTSVTIKPEGGKSAEKVAMIIKDGWEPHFVVAYGDITSDLQLICNYLNIEFCEY